ncbi:MAG TPA: hypothetical protein VFZ25_04440 [Chloroflexota bacterium]|nr:hypothetical protein [Chloroflexota bacterium]
MIPSGRDVWRISRALDAPPWTFVRYFRSPRDRPDAFRLDGSETRYRLALAKQPVEQTDGPPPCIFLTRLRGGDHRCGLGELRPAACRSFPSELVGGALQVRNDGGCTCRTWDLLDVDIAEETAKVETRQAEAVEFHQVVAYWNAQLADSPADRPYDFVDFCAFLMEAYDDLTVEEGPR